MDDDNEIDFKDHDAIDEDHEDDDYDYGDNVYDGPNVGEVLHEDDDNYMITRMIMIKGAEIYNNS